MGWCRDQRPSPWTLGGLWVVKQIILGRLSRGLACWLPIQHCGNCGRLHQLASYTDAPDHHSLPPPPYRLNSYSDSSLVAGRRQCSPAASTILYSSSSSSSSLLLVLLLQYRGALWLVCVLPTCTPRHSNFWCAFPLLINDILEVY